MVLLAAAVCTKAGKPLVSRQFVEMSRPRVEGLFISFPKLVEGSKGEHTFIDTDTVRFVYQPLDELFLVLLTSLSSNIIEDLETLHMFARIIPEFCNSISEAEVAMSAFDLISAFDEVVSMGYKEGVTLHQIKMNVEMDSHAERMDAMMRQNREQKAKATAKMEANRFAEDRRREAEDKRRMGGMGGRGMGSSSMSPRDYGGAQHSQYAASAHGGGGGAGAGASAAAPASSKKPASNAMKLGSKSSAGGSSSVDALIAQAGIREVTGARTKTAVPKNVDDGLENVTENLVLKCTETVDVKLTRDGGLEGMKLMGSLTVIALEDHGPLMVKIRIPEGISSKIDPNCDKNLFMQRGVLGFKDKARKIPTNRQGVTLVRWRMQSQDESQIPITITCWPNAGPNGFGMNIEVERQGDVELAEVQLLIPCPRQPDIASFGGEDASYDKRDKMIVWDIGAMDENEPNSNIEFMVRGGDKDDFFPIKASFTGQGSMCGVKVLGAKNVETSETVPHSKMATLVAGAYEVTN